MTIGYFISLDEMEQIEAIWPAVEVANMRMMSIYINAIK
jgi:hypothetical protein